MCVNEDKILRMKDLIKALTEADIAYYRDDDPVMSDREYDQLTDELLKLEAETGLVISGSPTQKVSGEVLEELTSGPAYQAHALRQENQVYRRNGTLCRRPLCSGFVEIGWSDHCAAL